MDCNPYRFKFKLPNEDEEDYDDEVIMAEGGDAEPKRKRTFFNTGHLGAEFVQAVSFHTFFVSLLQFLS